MNQTCRLIVANVYVAVLLTFFSGCIGDSDKPNVVKVTGHVEYDGAAVEGAQVVFVPVAENASPASAKTDAQGNFTLTTYWNATKSNLQGAMPGEYQVTVKKTEEPTQEEIDAAMQSGKSLQPAHQLPEKFATASKTPLTEQVSENGDNHFEFVLE